MGNIIIITLLLLILLLYKTLPIKINLFEHTQWEKRNKRKREPITDIVMGKQCMSTVNLKFKNENRCSLAWEGELESNTDEVQTDYLHRHFGYLYRTELLKWKTIVTETISSKPTRKVKHAHGKDWKEPSKSSPKTKQKVNKLL